MKNVAQLDSKDLILRRFEAKDNHDFIMLVTTEPFGRYSPFGLVDPEMAKSYFENALNIFTNTSDNPNKMHYQMWSVVDNVDNRFIGFSGYEHVVFEDTTYTMIFGDFFKQYLNTNIPLQAMQLVCNYAFNNNIAKLIAFVNPQDIETISLMSKMKFSLIKEAPYFGITMFLFSLEKAEFQK